MRSGVFLQQPGGFKAFNPATLPPNPPFHIDTEMLELNSRADLAIGRLDSLGDFIPNAELFVFMYVRKEAVISSQIEGTQATLTDILEFEAGNAEQDKRSDIDEVVNYLSAMDFGLLQIKASDGLPLSLRLIREVHKRLLAGVRGQHKTPGDFRTSQNWFGGASPTSATFVPPAVHDLGPALHDFERFLRGNKSLPPLIRTALLHYQFETIHPFLDGNGRVGRLLIALYLCHEGVLKHPLLYLSYYLKKHQQDYYSLLQAVRETGDYESWVKFFLQGVAETADEAVKTARSIIALKEADRAKMPALGRGMQRGTLLLERLFTTPVVSVSVVEGITGLSPKAAGDLVSKFVELGILAEVTGRKRNRTFHYQAYLDILSTR
ncbi:MAG TPA: Fic family protein [Candidatus Saccharimonadia bacterium]|nr:Fic family protein [Candidatus Saccharimonadia bacterium]